MKIGRNDPCPCGSGKKYKKCCMSPAAKVSDELRDLIDDQNFNSIEEAQAFANNHMRQRNQMPSDDFSGLSPDKKIPKSAGKGSTEDLSDFISDLRS